ncbi:hypothetical protein JCM11641_000894 [Rhodosporidiobolus odoratus]
MDAAMNALRQQQAQQSQTSPRRSRPPPAHGDRPGFAYPAHPYAATATPPSMRLSPQARMSAPVPPPVPFPGQDANFAAQLGNVMLTPEDRQEGYDSSLADLAPRGGPPVTLPPAPRSAPLPTLPSPISRSVPRYQLSDGPAPQPRAAPPLAMLPYPPPSRPPPVTMAPLPPLPLQAAPVTSELSRKPSLTVSSQAAENNPIVGERKGSDASYRAHDSPMPFRSFGMEQRNPAAEYGAYPRPPGSGESGVTVPPPMLPMGTARTPSPPPSIDVVPAQGTSEKIWADEVQAYRDIDAEDEAANRKKRKTTMAIGSIALLIIVIIAVAVGVSVSKHKSNDSDNKNLAASSSVTSSSSARQSASFLSHMSPNTRSSSSTVRADISDSSASSDSSTSSVSTSAAVSSSFSSAPVLATTSSRLITATRSPTTSVKYTSTPVLETISSTPTSGQVVSRSVEFETSETTTSQRGRPTSTGEDEDEDESEDEDEEEDEDEDADEDNGRPNWLNPFGLTQNRSHRSHRGRRRRSLHWGAPSPHRSKLSVALPVSLLHSLAR